MESAFRNVSIDRFKLAELVGIGKPLDEWAAAMGDANKPARISHWRGVGHLNLKRCRPFPARSTLWRAGRWCGYAAVGGELTAAAGCWTTFASLWRDKRRHTS